LPGLDLLYNSMLSFKTPVLLTYVSIIADLARLVNRFLVFLAVFLAQKCCIFATLSGLGLQFERCVQVLLLAFRRG